MCSCHVVLFGQDIRGEPSSAMIEYLFGFLHQEPEIGLARTLIDFIKADETPPELIKESLETLTMFDEKQAKAIAVVNGIKKPGHFQFCIFISLCGK